MDTTSIKEQCVMTQRQLAQERDKLRALMKEDMRMLRSYLEELKEVGLAIKHGLVAQRQCAFKKESSNNL